ncbi:unnamed protein product [marine sediment metagenome]|uniref:Uncharacterized protein n=1 Tax=marine sediment metagenome TaxID=412755 RepID=X1Q501_9ZZZZ
MTLEKAKEILTLFYNGYKSLPDPELLEAARLSVEAIKWRQLMKRDYGSWFGLLLPGETEE